MSSSRPFRRPSAAGLLVGLLLCLIAGPVLALPARAATICATCVGVIGDSLSYQNGTGPAAVTSALVGDGWSAGNVTVDAAVGRPIAQDFTGGIGTVTTISSWRAAGFDPAVFVLQLGSNNKNATTATWTTEVTKVLTAIGPGHTIVWFDLGFADQADPRVAAFNANLASIAAGRTDLFITRATNGQDWNTWIHAQPNQSSLWLSADTSGVHMTSAGYTLRNSFLGQAMSRFVGAVSSVNSVTEYVLNPSVETDLSGWGGLASAQSQVTRSSAAAFDGTWSIRTGNSSAATAATIGFGTATTGGASHWVTATVAGATYTGSVWVRASATGQVLKLFLREQRADGTAPTSPSVTVAWTATDTGWHQLSGAYVAKESGNSLLYKVWMDNAAPAASFFADGMSLKR